MTNLNKAKFPSRSAAQEQKLRGRPTKAKRWWRGKDPLYWIGSISTISAAFSVVVAAWIYISESYQEVNLLVDKPYVVEFRCSTLSFDSDRCFYPDPRSDYSHLSLSAALRMRSVGPNSKSATIRRVEAKILIDGRSITLTSFWSGQLTGQDVDSREKNSGFQQIVALSLQGGRSISREIWFMPMAKSPACVPHEDSIDCFPEREDFMPWERFIGTIWNIIDRSASSKETEAISVNFKVVWQAGDVLKTEDIGCLIEIGATARSQARDFDVNGKVVKPLYVTLPCV